MRLVIPEESKLLREDAKRDERRLDVENMKLCACGKVFQPYRAFQKYCSDTCRVKFSKGKATTYIKKSVESHKCKQCGRMFMSNNDKRHYCSDTCYILHEVNRRKKPEKRTCFVCDRAFTTTHWSKRYCSEACRMEARDG